eukprot:13924647-Ditylum_brightwellii.AAC.1
MRVVTVTVTVIVASGGKSVHFVIAFFLAAVVNVWGTKLVKGVCFCALSKSVQLKAVLYVMGPITPMHFTVEL